MAAKIILYEVCQTLIQKQLFFINFTSCNKTVFVNIQSFKINNFYN